MIENAQNFSDAFVAAGADMLTYHIEVMTKDSLERESKKLRAAKRGVGISLNPATPASAIIPILDLVDFILVMSVNPGFGGQAFIPEVVAKIAQLRKVFKGDISVDGGISDVTAKTVVAAGATVLAAGSYIFKAADYAQAIRSLKCAK
jgi:ribulose-phosphate 3-epimerase